MTRLAEKTPEGAPVEDAPVLDHERSESLWRRLSPEARRLALMVLASTAAYTLLGLVESFPQTYPDEFLYQGLAESLANGDGLNIRGQGQDLLSLLYVIVIAPAWVLASGEEAYSLAKLINAAGISLTAVPVWLLARELTGSPRRALVPAALTLLGSWMLFSHQIVTENVALPLAMASFAATVAALRAPGSRWWLAALALAGAAGFARTHLLALGLVVLAAPFLDALRQERGRRLARLRAHRAWALTLVALGAVAAVSLVASDLSVLGRYDDLNNTGTEVGDALTWSAYHALAVALMSGLVPAVAVLALAARRRNWRDDATGPLLVVFAAAFCVLVGLAGWFTAAKTGWPIERYVLYLAPLMLVALVLAPGRVGMGTTLAAAAAVALALLALPEAEQLAEAKAINAARELAAGVFEGSPEVGVALFAAFVAGAGALLLSLGRPVMPVAAPPPARIPKGSAARARALKEAERRKRSLSFRTRSALAGPSSGALVAIGLTALVLGAGTIKAAEMHLDRFGEQRSGLPDDLSWVDAATGKRSVGLLALEPRTSRVNQITDFFNRNVRGAYHLGGVPIEDLGANCVLAVAQDGGLSAEGPCEPPPSDILIEDGIARAHLHAEVERRVTVYSGALVRTSEPKPRLLSVVIPPCNERFGRCSGEFRLNLWLDQPEQVVLTVRGSAQDESVVLPDGQVLSLEANALSRVTLNVPAGAQDVRLPVSWDTFDGPKLESAVLVRPGDDLVIY